MCVCCSSMWCNPWSSCCCRGKMRGLPFLPWLPLAASGCQALPSAAARGCLSQGCLCLPEQSWTRGGREVSGQHLSKDCSLQRERELGPEGAPQTETRLLSPRVKPELAPVLWEPLKGTSSPCALPSCGGRTSLPSAAEAELTWARCPSAPGAGLFVLTQYLRLLSSPGWGCTPGTCCSSKPRGSRKFSSLG